MSVSDYRLAITLLSDTTFGRGDGVAGLVDDEVEHDASTGLPFLRGRQLKGLLVEECDSLLYSAQQIDSRRFDELIKVTEDLFGRAGSDLSGQANLKVGDARLPSAVEATVRNALDAKTLTVTDVLESLTAIRYQTAVNDAGVPEDNSLRSMRVLLRSVVLEARSTFASTPTSDQLALLAACAAATRRAGTGRNRGRGRVQIRLLINGQDATEPHLAHFATLLEVNP